MTSLSLGPLTTYPPQPGAASTLTSTALADLLALVQGVPVLLEKIDLVELANDLYDCLLTGEPDQTPLALAAVDFYLFEVGDQRRVGGRRARAMAGGLCRYVLPFLLEVRAGTSPGRGRICPITGGPANMRDAIEFAQILAGERPLPAATVAADRLRRQGINCIWLSVEDAATVSGLDRASVMAANAAGELPLYLTDDGTAVVRSADLRAAGLLIEPASAHGLAKDSADNVLQLLHATCQRAADYGAPSVPDLSRIKSKNPLPQNQLREPKDHPRSYVSVEDCVQMAAHLHPLHQAALWTCRLLGLRVGEAFGCTVADLDGTLLRVKAVGGTVTDVRGTNGQITKASRREGTKGTREGVAHKRKERTVPVPDQLLALLHTLNAIFHTDPSTGALRTHSRLIPALRTEDSGINAFQSALQEAARKIGWAECGSASLTPHDLRASLRTDLGNQGVNERFSRHLLGHQDKHGRSLDVHERHYDLGLDQDALESLRRDLANLLQDVETLMIATTKSPSIGQQAVHADEKDSIKQHLRDLGWCVAPASGPADLTDVSAQDPGREVGVPEAARRLELSATQVKRLLSNGTLSGRKSPTGNVVQWLITEESLNQELARRDCVRLKDLAEQWQLPYHDLWQIAHELGLTSDRPPGTAILLTPEQQQSLHAAVQERSTALSDSMTHNQAAQQLGVTDQMVQTLVRSGHLERAPRSNRIERVTRASVNRYAQQYPFTPVADDEKVVSCADARVVLGLTRSDISDLTKKRELSVVEIDRRQYIGSHSLRAYLKRHPTPGALDRLQALEVART